jgi:hypothetical protein
VTKTRRQVILIAVRNLNKKKLTTRLFEVASFKIDEHSDISSRNVDDPIARLSLAPMRVYTPSSTVNSADAAGT